MNYKKLLESVEAYFRQTAAGDPDSPLCYHNLEHTEGVVRAAKRIGHHYKLDDHDSFIVEAAAWFHDIGYYASHRKNHEEHGVKVAVDFFRDKKVDEGVVKKLSNCILATKLPQKASSLLEKIICDADMFHLGSDSFLERDKLMRKETESILNTKVDKAEWRAGTIELMKSHSYFTDYCQQLLNDKKQKNLQKLLKKQLQEDIVDGKAGGVEADEENTKTPGRGIETMFRITSTNNQRLSDMADNKAQILITVNSIILSAVISFLLRNLAENPFLAYPTLLLLIVSVVTIVVGILATRPSLPNGTFTQDEIKGKSANLLFFGNFFKMSLNDYSEGMKAIMKDRDFLYGTLIKDVYSQGVVLGKKYFLLRLAYNIFMFGLIVSIVGFIVAVVLADHLL